MLRLGINNAALMKLLNPMLDIIIINFLCGEYSQKVCDCKLFYGFGRRNKRRIKLWQMDFKVVRKILCKHPRAGL